MSPNDHFRTLDFLRGTAALCVLLLHWFNGVGLPWFQNAGLAVDFFFLLSGFVIAHSYETRLLTTMSGKRFLWLRFIRLYPMILAGAAFGLLRHILHNHYVPNSATWQNYLEAGIAGILMIPVLHITPLSPGYGGHQPVVEGSAFPLDMALWSLFYEGVANIAYALAVKQLNATRLLAIISFGWIGLSITNLPFMHTRQIATLFGAASFRVIFSFFLGVALFRLRRAHYLPATSGGSLPLSAALLAIATIPLQSAVFNLFAITLVFPSILLLGANNNSTSLDRSSRLLGDLSYPVYVLQIPLMWILTGALKSLHLYGRLPRLPLGLIVAATICAGSWLALQFYDIPVRKWLASKPLQPKIENLRTSAATR